MQYLKDIKCSKCDSKKPPSEFPKKERGGSEGTGRLKECKRCNEKSKIAKLKFYHKKRMEELGINPPPPPKEVKASNGSRLSWHRLGEEFRGVQVEQS